MESGHSRDYAAIALQYAKEAWADRKGRRHCRWVRLAAKRHLDDMKRSRRRSGWAYRFDDWHAGDVCDFIEKLPHIEGRWESPTIVLEPWQVFILAVVFGWRRVEDGCRRFETAYIELARKNGKSALSSGVALYCLTCDGEPAPQVKCAATTGDQARIVFNVAKKMAEKTPDLRAAFDVEPLANAIVCNESDGSIQPINAKASTQDGLNPHLTIIDELHAHKDRDLFDVLKSASGARDNALAWYITTAGYNLQGVCYEQRKLVTKILQGLIPSEHYFGIIYTLDNPEDRFDETKWVLANPNLGISPKVRRMQSYAADARNSPDSLLEFDTKRLNIWGGAKAAWLNLARWRRCGGPVDLEALERVPCYGGLDLAAVSDINALLLTWLVEDRLKVWGRYYLPEETVRPRSEKGNVPYQVWADQGLLTLTPGNVADYEFIEADVESALGRFDVRAIGFDPWNARDMANRLIAKGAPMIEFRQGPQSFNAPMKEFERHVNGGTMDHGGDPILTWMASNIVARKDVNDNMAPDKKNSEEKIDGIVAACEAVGVMLTDEPKKIPTAMWV